MTNGNSSDRLDRIERILENVASTLVEIDSRINSNAKAIEASQSERREFERNLERDRVRLYQSLSNLANAQAAMATTHAEFQSSFFSRQQELDKRQEELSRRQGEIVEILKLLQQSQQNQ